MLIWKKEHQIFESKNLNNKRQTLTNLIKEHKREEGSKISIPSRRIEMETTRKGKGKRNNLWYEP